ncbi:MAG: hypothetical protein OXC95_17730 [Dehalococcoidia bacterium]|nr:hypothetical protein [Dehalococcoidia bacterium]
MSETTYPKDDLTALVRFQNVLLSEAESALGPRDQTYQILPPRFLGNQRPSIYYFPDKAYISLTPRAAMYWNAAKGELSHEVVHLLNPIPGFTNYLEEGVATAFSQYAAARHGIYYPSSGGYEIALGLVKQLSDNALDAGKLLRDRIGALSDVSAPDLVIHFPHVSKGVAERLSEEFDL